MTYDEFIDYYIGKAIDYDGGFGVQCVDTIKLYFDKVLGIKPQAIGNAVDYWKRYDELSYLHDNFERIENTPSFVPKKGDICVWGEKLSKNGHVAVASGIGDTKNFYSYDQNWNGKEMKKVLHNYSGFLGVLRPYKNLNETKKEFFNKIYRNGSTDEFVYSDTLCKNSIGYLTPNEDCICLGIIDNKAIVLYNTTNGKKVRFC